MSQVYSNSDDIVTVISEDFTGRKILKRRSNANDSESIKNLFQSIIDKYGLLLEIKSIDKIDKLGWLKSDEEFKF